MRSKLKKLKKNIAVLMGGYSDEFEISIKSGNNILKNSDDWKKAFSSYYEDKKLMNSFWSAS